MKSKIFRSITTQAALRTAWRKVYENGRASRSTITKEEVEEFSQDSDKKIRKLQRELRSDRFAFPPSIGKKIPKKNPGDFRPLVIAPIETRIVQRAVLDFLLSDPNLRCYAETPHSFGGVKKRENESLAAVPAAIHSALEAKANGCEFVRCADIASFFTRIRKSAVRKIVSKAIPDRDFLDLFEDCIKVELSNLAKLGSGAARFPREDLGVAQGSSLSPLMGNILLHEFDQRMNEGGCRCIRYIDDILILGPTAKDVSHRFRLAKSLLAELEMEFSEEKSSFGIQTFTKGFVFLGIQIINGLVRPDSQSVGRFKEKVNRIVAETALQMQGPEDKFRPESALVPTIQRVTGTVYGWGKHYRFCNDTLVLDHLDEYVDKELRKLLGAYASARAKGTIPARTLLGVSLLSSLPREPFEWPKALST